MPRTLLGVQHVVDFSKIDKHIAKIEVFVHSDNEIQNPESALTICCDVWQLWIRNNEIKYLHHPYVMIDLEKQLFMDRRTKKVCECLNTAPNRIEAFKDIEGILERVKNGQIRTEHKNSKEIGYKALL